MSRPHSGRTRNLRLIVSDEELSMAHTLADDAGLTMSDIIRLLIREAYGRRIPTRREAKAKRSKQPSRKEV